MKRLLNFYYACRRLYLFKKENRAMLKKQNTCEHEKSMTVIIPGPWGPTIPHPHPIFAEQMKVQIQPICRVSVCFKCNKVFADFLYNQRDAEAELFELKETQTDKANPSFVPEHVD